MVDQICSLMETTVRHRAGERGLPSGLPLHWRMHFWPRANVCMFSADLIRFGTCLMMIFRVTLRRRKVRPLMMSPGLFDFPSGPNLGSSCQDRPKLGAAWAEPGPILQRGFVQGHVGHNSGAKCPTRDQTS